MQKTEASSRVHIFFVMARYLSPQTKIDLLRFIGMFGFLISGSLIATALPLLFRTIIKAIEQSSSNSMHASLALIIGYGMLWIFNKILMSAREMIMLPLFETAVKNLTINLFSHIIKLPLLFHNGTRVGTLVDDIKRAQYSFPDTFYSLIHYFIPLFFQIIFSIGSIWYFYGLFFAMPIFITFTAYLSFIVYYSSFVLKHRTHYNNAIGKAMGYAVEGLLNYQSIKTMQTENLESDNFSHHMKAAGSAQLLQWQNHTIMHIGEALILGICMIFTTITSGTSIASKSLTIADFIVLNGYLIQFIGPLSTAAHLIKYVTIGLIDLEKIFHLLHTKEEPALLTATPLPLLQEKPSVLFDNISFGYEGKKQLFDNFTLEIKQGETLGVVGLSGSGKSTLGKILLHYYPINNGRILLDNRATHTLPLSFIRQSIGYVAQDTPLFNETLRFNLTYGTAHVTEKEMNDLVKQVGLEHLISQSSHGYDTIVGERGIKLSLGERQRISIVRAILKKPKLFIFDEATSSVDVIAERAIRKSMELVRRNATTIIIAHRLSTVIHADRIIVLSQGKIIDEGTHEQLLMTHGPYSKLWRSQHGSWAKGMEDDLS